MVNAILFPECGWELSQQGQQELNKIVPTLQGMSGKQIVIQGYTDNLPILPPLSDRFPTNWNFCWPRHLCGPLPGANGNRSKPAFRGGLWQVPPDCFK